MTAPVPSLLRRASEPDVRDGATQRVTPADAGWHWISCSTYRLGMGQVIERPGDGQEVAVVVLEGSADVTAGTRRFGSLGSRTSVFDGPPPPVVLVAAGEPVTVRADGATSVLIASAPSGESGADPAHRAGHDARRGAWQRPDRPTGASPAAAGCPRVASHPGGGVHARWQLVQLSAAQARHRGPAARVTAGGALLLPVREAAGFRVRARLYGGPKRWTRRSRPWMAIWCSCPGDSTRWGCRPDTMATT